MKFLPSLLAVLSASAVAAPAHDMDVKRALVDDAAPHQNDPNFISAVMRAHWYWRRLHCAQDLRWDSELADAARKDLEICKDKPVHERPGSNLSSVSPAPGSYDAWIEFARTATHGWHEEECVYPYDNPHFDDKWGHFTQMVWRNSSTIGCAVGHCADNVQWPGRFVCYYSFFGNNIAAGQFQQQVWGPVCGDPAVSEVRARENPKFDWAAATH